MPRLARFLAALFVLAPIVACQPGAEPPVTVAEDRALVEKIDRIAAEVIDDEVSVGLSVAVARGALPLLARGYGYANLENEVAAGPETVYRIGSVTKQFTAVAILQLVEAGQLALDDSLAELLPDYSTQRHTVTVHHLLNHTSGIKSYTGLGPEFWDRSRLDLSHEQLLGMIEGKPFDFAPGEEYAYNNSGYYLLGVIIERLTGKSYPEYMRENVFAAAGLFSTYYCDNEPIIRNRAAGYARRDGELVNAAMLSMKSPFSAGALCSTVLDLLTWNRALHGHRLISPASTELLITPGTLNSGQPLTYGYGLAIGELEGNRRIAHGGGINGFNAYLSYYPDDDLTIAVLANTEGSNPGRIERRIARAVLKLPEPEIANLPIPEDLRARCVGTYALAAEGVEIVVTAEEGDLLFSIAGQDPVRLLYQGEGVFVASDDEEVVLSFSGEGEHAETLTLRTPGGEYTATRQQ